MLLCVGLAALPSASLGARGELLADQRLNLNLSFSSASLREVVSAFTEQTGVVFSYETSLGKRHGHLLEDHGSRGGAHRHTLVEKKHVDRPRPLSLRQP